MVTRRLLVGFGVFAVASIAVFLWARAVFTQDTVRVALAGQLSRALGHPVTIGSIGAAIFPRVTVNLGDVSIGTHSRIFIERLQVGTSFRALLSRRIEHADLRLTGARIELPLPAFAVMTGSETSGPSAEAPVELVSIDEIALSDVQIVSGGRTLLGDLELVPQGKGAVIRKAHLEAGDASIDITGRIIDFAGPSAELSATSGTLNLDELIAFASAFAGGVGGSGDATAAAQAPMDIAMSLAAESAKLGTLTLGSLSGRARMTRDAVTLEPITFGLFGGKYSGTLGLSLGARQGFRLAATLSDIDMAAVTKFAGSADTMTGRLFGKVDLAGSARDAASALTSAKGTARVTVANGTVRNLGLVRAIVVATSGRSDAAPHSADLSRDEPFSRLGATLAIAGGTASTSDLSFESSDLLMTAAGSLRLDGSAIDLVGQAQLSDALAKRAGRDLVRYTQEQGRPTLPVRITGSSGAPRVVIDTTGVLRRAIANRATEEVHGVVSKGLGGLFGK
jgi:uncharacterized protein involved in outer membrane biogenesis